jgi:hypothetical protein
MRRLISLSCVVLFAGCGEGSKGGLIDSTTPKTEETIQEAKVEGPINHNPREVIERAIDAHGGPVQLGRLRTFIRSDAGQIIQRGGSKVMASREVVLALPDQCRLNFEIQAGTERLPTVLVVAGNQGWLSGAGNVQDLTREAVEDIRGEIHLNNILTLLPLASMEVTALPAITLGEQQALGVQVVAKGHAPIKVWFDQKTGHLVKAERSGFEGGEAITRAYYFSEFKDQGGPKLPTRQMETVNGAFAANWTISGYKIVDSLPADTFKKP